MTRLLRAISLCSAILALGGACTGPEADLFSIQGVVTGRVRNASGASLPQATVHATATYPLAGGAFPLTDSARTGPDGVYAVRFVTGNLADARVPLTLTVNPPAGSGLVAHDTTGLTVLIARAAPPRDTTYVDVVLLTP
jgi:hypothetical protein